MFGPAFWEMIPPIYLIIKYNTNIILNLNICRLGGVLMPILKSKGD
jgi:hypothetical protein